MTQPQPASFERGGRLDLDRTVTLRDVLGELHQGFGWPAGTPEYDAMTMTAKMIEREAIQRGGVCNPVHVFTAASDSCLCGEQRVQRP